MRTRSRTRALVTAVAATLVAGVGLSALPAGAAPASAPTRPVYLDTRYSFAERAADLVSRMTLAEKVAQLHTSSAPAISRLGVQQYTYWSEGQHGVNTIGANTNYGASGNMWSPHATSFPTNLASTMSWDPDLVYQETPAISDEARGFLDKSLWGVAENNIGPDRDNYGSLTYWAPTVNMDRDPRWGRTDEAFGEDPYLVARMAGAFVDGYQGQTESGTPTSRYLKVAATAKHYALNDVENNRYGISSDTTDANVRDYYTAQFRSLVQDSNVSGLMTSYNAVNGTPSPVNTYTANLLAQRTYGFDGYTTSDCGAVGNVYNTYNHNWAAPGWSTSSVNGTPVWTNITTGQQLSGAAGGQAYALRAGTQLNCTGAEATLANIQEAISAGVLSEGVLDAALVQVFTIRMRTGEFDPPAAVPYTKITKNEIESTEHQALAEKVAANSIVLLKNDTVPGTTGPLLPANPATLDSVVIVGDLANTVTLGGYSGTPSHTVSPVQGITSAVHAANPTASVVFDACGTSTRATAAADCSASTRAAIADADLVVVVAGTDGAVAGEGTDRSTLALPGNYTSLVNQVTALGNHRTVLALQTDGPVTIDGVQGGVPAIVYSAYNGQSQGSALASVLFGEQNPSGHLDFTWYADDSQLPAISNYGLTPAQTDGLGRTYQYFTGTPTYPFGYGLSYTTFAYRKLAVSRRRATGDQTVRVSFDVTNTGRTAGATVAQLYVSPPAGAATDQEAPARKLAGFAKTRVLAPGATQRIMLAVPLADLSVWNSTTGRQEVRRGSYGFAVGPDSATVALRGSVQVTADATPTVRTVTVQPGQVVFTPGERLELTGTNPWIADDTAQAAEHAKADGIVSAVRSDQSFVDLTRATVTYRSSNPRVARVSRTGRLTAVAPGTTTVSVTVDGVTGSAPITVREPFTLTAPAMVVPGSTFTATATMPNPPAGTTLRDVTMTLATPSGWTAQATTPATFARVSAGRTASTTWRVSVPAGLRGSVQELTAQVSFTSPAGRGSSTDVTSVSVPYASLADARTNVAVSDDSNPNAANLDGGGRSFSAQALAAARPSLTPGASVTHDGLTFTWPDVPVGAADNAVANGETIAISGSGSRLGLLGTANNGTASGTATITYTDGTTQAFSLAFADWWANSAATGSDILTTVPYINTSTGRMDQSVSVYSASVALQAGKTVRYLTLPDVNHGATSGLMMHIFAITIG